MNGENLWQLIAVWIVLGAAIVWLLYRLRRRKQGCGCDGCDGSAPCCRENRTRRGKQ